VVDVNWLRLLWFSGTCTAYWLLVPLLAVLLATAHLLRFLGCGSELELESELKSELDSELELSSRPRVGWSFFSSSLSLMLLRPSFSLSKVDTLNLTVICLSGQMSFPFTHRGDGWTGPN
jgi:hypothetical protein